MGFNVNWLLTIAILAISTAQLCAQDQQSNVAKLKVDAQKVVSIISGDKAKTQTYCQIANVGEQMNEAVQWRDKKKFDELAQKLPELEKSLGPEYLGLVESLTKASLPPTMRDGFAEEADDTRLQRRMVERVLAACENADSGEIAPLITLLRRFATEAAREEARQFCEEIAEPPRLIYSAAA